MDREKEALDSVLRALELDALIRQGAIKLPEPKPMELMLKEAKAARLIRKDGKIDGRTLAGKKRREKNAKLRKKRKLKAAEQQRWRRSWKERSLSKALNGNYYAYYEKRWREKRRPFKFTEAQWLEHVQPLIPEGSILELRRYNTKAPVTLDNLIVYDGSNGSVLFDGKEWFMRHKGYML